MLQALDRYWHEDCLKCACCDCRLGRVGSTLYTRANLILCRRDYLRYVRLLQVYLDWLHSAASKQIIPVITAIAIIVKCTFCSLLIELKYCIRFKKQTVVTVVKGNSLIM